MSEIDLILKLWPVFTCFAFGIVWFIRLESKVAYLDKDHSNLVTSVKEKDLAMWSKIDSIQTTLNQLLQAIARLEGKMDVRNHEE